MAHADTHHSAGNALAPANIALPAVALNFRKLNDAVRPENNALFEFFGLRTVYDRYLLRHPSERKVVETPLTDAEKALLVEAYEAGRQRARQAAGGPAEALGKTADTDGPVRYTAPTIVFTGPDDRVLEAGGMLPTEAYEMAIANLDPSIERRDPPESPAEALSAFPSGLTTAEVAEVMRPSGMPGDLEAARTALEELEVAGEVTRETLGDDALWRAA